MATHGVREETGEDSEERQDHDRLHHRHVKALVMTAFRSHLGIV